MWRARADRIYEIMVRRGVVIPEYEEMISEPEKIEGEDLKSPQEPSQPSAPDNATKADKPGSVSPQQKRQPANGQ